MSAKTKSLIESPKSSLLPLGAVGLQKLINARLRLNVTDRLIEGFLHQTDDDIEEDRTFFEMIQEEIRHVARLVEDVTIYVKYGKESHEARHELSGEKAD